MKELLFSITEKDFDWDYYRASGAGGQHRNKVSTAVRCKHKESGAMAVAADTRSQRQNRILAFRRIAETPKFKLWLKLKTSEAMLSKE